MEVHKVISRQTAFIRKSAAFLGEKTFRLALVMCLVCAMSFVLVQNSPVDPVRAYIGADANQIGTEQRTLIAERWGLDRPPAERFARWAGQIVRGNLGTSMIFNEPVTSVIGKRFVVSLGLMAAAWVLSGILGFALGIISGVWHRRAVSKMIDLYCFVLASAPVFWIAIILLVFFSVMLQWTPVSGSTPAGIPAGEITLAQRLHHMLLPCASLSVISIAGVALHTKKKTVEIMQSDYILYARARGESTFGIVRRHVLRNSLLPAISLHFSSLNEIFGGSVLVEQVFGYPGLGKATVDAGIRGDVPLLLGITIFTTIFIFFGNAAADYLYTVIDPRMRHMEKINEY